MTDGVKINQLPTLPGTFDGTEYLPFMRAGATYKQTVAVLSAYLTVGINRPPVSSNQTASSDDTVLQLTGNILTGTSDPDGDPITIQYLSYNGTVEAVNDGSFQTTYGIFFLNPATGAWTFTLGVAARALTTGDIAHEIFTYTFADGRGGLSTSTLTITLTGTNSIPVVSSVNGQTPMNITINGNLLYRESFDYEPTPLSILHYVIDGITGTWSAGTGKLITGKGTITIESTGDYTFAPVTDFFGPVPTITYTVTDGGNNVDAYLRLSVNPLIPGTQPIIIMTDIESGPISGGEGNNGALMSILGFRFGSSSDLGGTTKVYIGGQEVAHYWTHEDARASVRHPGMKHIRVQVGALGGSLTLGKPYPITVVTAGGTSNASFNFTPNPGRILYASKSGNNATAVANDIAHPWRNLQMPARGDESIYTEVRAGDQVVIRGGAGVLWQDLGFDTAWFRFRDPTQQGSNPTGAAGTGWISFTGYPNEEVHYKTPGGGAKGGFQGPGSAFNGTCGDWVSFSNMHLEVDGGSSSDGAPINLQYNAERARIVNMEMGPWVAGTSAHLNAACVTGQGNIVIISCNDIHDIEGTTEQQNHGTYGGTSAYGWKISFNSLRNCVGGSHIQFNDSDGGTGNLNTPFGLWTGFTALEIHHNWCENSAKYGFTCSDVGAYAGTLDFVCYNNVFIHTGLAPLRLNTTTLTSDGLYCFNTTYNCNWVNNPGTGNAVTRNEGTQTSPNHSIKAYNNIFAFGPDTVAAMQWHADPNGQSSGYVFSRNLYWAAGQTPTSPSDSLAVTGDPLFTNPTATPADLSLQSGSPATNSGTQALPTGFRVDDDFTALATRQFGGAPDIGAFEIGQTTPYSIVYPTYTGGPQVGVSSSVTLGTWGNTPTSYSRQFTADNASSGSAVTTSSGNATRTWVASEAGKVGRCEVTATNAEGSTLFTLTLGTIVVGTGAPVNTVPPAITGTLSAGNTLTGSDGTWTVSSGTIGSYTYKWYRNGIFTGTTTNTYALTSADVGYPMRFESRAEDSTTGGVTATSTSTANIAAAAANPVVVQSIDHTIPTSGPQAIVFGSDVSGGNLILTFFGLWDQHTYNASLSDSQGHSSASSNYSFAGDHAVMSNNPCINWAWLLSTATGAYTTTINSNGSSGGSGVCVEVTGVNPSAFMDVSPTYAEGLGTAIALTGSSANTKGNDLMLVGVSVAGAGQTLTTPSGWTLEQFIDTGGFQTLAVYSKKCTTAETLSFASTIGASTNWGVYSVIIKGST